MPAVHSGSHYTDSFSMMSRQLGASNDCIATIIVPLINNSELMALVILVVIVLFLILSILLAISLVSHILVAYMCNSVFPAQNVVLCQVIF